MTDWGVTMRSTRQSTRVASMLATGGAAAVLALTGCSSGAKANGNNVTAGQSPQTAVQTAVSNLGKQSDVQIALSLPITPAQAKELTAKGGGKPISDQEANALTSGTVFVNVSTGNGEPIDSAQAQNDPNLSVDLGLTIGKDTPLEIRYVGQNLYARAQVQQLLTDVGQDPTQASQFTNELSSLNSYVPGLSALGKGDWVEVSNASLQSLTPLLKQIESSSGASSNPSALKGDIMKLRTEVVTAVQANSTFASAGSGNYTVTVHVASLLNTLKPEIQNALGNIPSLGTSISNALNTAQSKVSPGQTAVIQVGVSNNTLSHASVDLNQFAGKDKVSFPVPLQVAFTSPGAPAAPSSATKLDLSKLPAMLGNLLGGAGNSSAPTTAG